MGRNALQPWRLRFCGPPWLLASVSTRCARRSRCSCSTLKKAHSFCSARCSPLPVMELRHAGNSHCFALHEQRQPAQMCIDTIWSDGALTLPNCQLCVRVIASFHLLRQAPLLLLQTLLQHTGSDADGLKPSRQLAQGLGIWPAPVPKLTSIHELLQRASTWFAPAIQRSTCPEQAVVPRLPAAPM